MQVVLACLEWFRRNSFLKCVLQHKIAENSLFGIQGRSRPSMLVPLESSILLYRCESWIPYRRHVKALEAYHICCLQSILGIRWWHSKTHIEICNSVKLESVDNLMLQRQLWWLGHDIRMPSNRLPRRLLYGELLGQRPVG